MNEMRNTFHPIAPPAARGEQVCIDTMRILDSCRDKDCYEDVRCYLTDFGQEVLEKTNSIRVKSTEVICANILVDPIQFNRGFYQITIRFYTKLYLEACICHGKSQELEGIAVTEKKVVLFGSEGGARVFKSSGGNEEFCSCNKEFDEGCNLPTVVVETVDPIALSLKIKEKCDCCHCCCCVEDMPKRVSDCVCGNLCDYPGMKYLFVTLGFFSVVRIERPAQIVVSAAEYCIPDKECVLGSEDDPCQIFAKMSFPVEEFCPRTTSPGGMGCDCNKGKCK